MFLSIIVCQVLKVAVLGFIAHVPHSIKRAAPTKQEKYKLYMGVSNRWTGIWNGTMEWKMEWNSEST